MPSVVIADDDEYVRYYLKTLLTEANYNVVGEVGVGSRLFETINDTQPDILLLDIHMPELNGDKFLLQHKEDVKDICVVVLTMSISDEVQKKLEDAGFEYIMRKNVTPDDLLDYIRFSLKHFQLNRVD